MASVRYVVITDLPPQVRSGPFCDLADGEVRIRLLMRDESLVVVAHGSDAQACELLLRQLGATEIGLDLCG